MQTIESSVLRIAVDEKDAQVVNLVSQSNQVDYFKDGDVQKQLKVAFTGVDQSENWAELLPWTVVDKGDARVSLALIDDGTSYKKFPYHFEAILTYSLDGNNVDIKCYLKNNSHKEMPFSLVFTLPILADWSKSKNVNEVELKHEDTVLKVSSSNFALAIAGDYILAKANVTTLQSDDSNEFGLKLTLS